MSLWPASVCFSLISGLQDLVVRPRILRPSEVGGKMSVRGVLQQQIQQHAARHKARKGCKATKLAGLKGMQDTRLQDATCRLVAPKGASGYSVADSSYVRCEPKVVLTGLFFANLDFRSVWGRSLCNSNCIPKKTPRSIIIYQIQFSQLFSSFRTPRQRLIPKSSKTNTCRPAKPANA